jgi:hypothetical protein
MLMEASNCRVVSELERMENEIAVAQFGALSGHLPGGTEENNRKPHSSYAVSRPRSSNGASPE